MRVTLTPDRRAVTRLVPMANRCLPNAVRSSSSHINNPKMIQITIAPGMPRNTGRAINCVIAGATDPLTLPCVMTRIMPLTRPAMPSVMTSGEILRKVIPAPFRKPIAAPTINTANKAGSTFSFLPFTIE